MGAGSNKNTRPKSAYVPALAGLRAFAVLAVILYHMKVGWAPGGLMGVTVFFVISGYLINGLLVAEHEATGRISLKGFWMRRVRRLFPAIALAVVGTAALCTVFDHVLLDKMRPDIAPSLLFYNNWWQIFRDLSYFEAAGAPSPLQHFWSLSIEEQFYLVWPLALILMYKLGFKKKHIAAVAIVLAVASGAEMTLLYDPHGDPSRIYYGTDTRAMSLLVGVWLAFALPSAAFGKDPGITKDDRFTWITLNIVGVCAFAGLVAIVAFTNGFSAFPYQGGIALTTVLSAIVIVVLVVPGTWMARVFALKPLVWIGKRSYGMYLWHFPIILLTTNFNTTTGTPWWMWLVQIALIFVVSALSFTFVEDPIRKGVIRAWWRQRAAKKSAGAHAGGGEGERSGRVGASAFVVSACFVALLGVALYGVFAVQPTDYAAVYAGAGKSGSASSADSESAGSEGSESAASSGSSAAASYEEAFGQQRLNAAGKPVYEPLLIGDSVSLGAEDEFYRVFPHGHLDSVVSRNIWESPYDEYFAADQVGDCVVFCLGTNNAVEGWQIDEDLLSSVGNDKKVFLVNTRSTTDWMEGTNAEIARAPERHPNVVVVDWYRASEGHDEYFAGDGTHLTEDGARAYVALIDEAIRKSYE